MLPQVNYLLANASLDIDANFYPPGPEEIRRASVMEAPQNTVGEPEVARRRNPVPFRGNHRQRRIDMLSKFMQTVVPKVFHSKI